MRRLNFIGFFAILLVSSSALANVLAMPMLSCKLVSTSATGGESSTAVVTDSEKEIELAGDTYQGKTTFSGKILLENDGIEGSINVNGDSAFISLMAPTGELLITSVATAGLTGTTGGKFFLSTANFDDRTEPYIIAQLQCYIK